jgi:protein tyrosine phosphatase (PTP) superfamily phosphohydrolase (DUF442 family)
MLSDDETPAQKERRDKLNSYAHKLVTMCKIHLPQAAGARIAVILFDEQMFAYASSGARTEALNILKQLVQKLELDQEAAAYRGELLK